MTISNRFHDKVTTELEWMGREELSHDLVAEVAAGLKDFDCIVAGPDLGRDPHSFERVLDAEGNNQDASEDYRVR
ncbi:hypothetical protein MKX03_009613 [Papaver bracteatum]|nr:hypothetical protein MKX03_009613 [Papaver bracteatum]